MAYKGLSKEVIVEAAVKLMEEKGYTKFSMRELAAALGVKTASLYNHVKNIDEVYTQIGYCAVAHLKAALQQAVQGKSRDAAVMALALAYRAFAKQRPELYRVIMRLPDAPDAALERDAAQIIEPLLAVLGGYKLTQQQVCHWQRVLRSLMHGFISQEEAGFFNHLPVDVETSYRIAVGCFITGLHAEEVKEHENGQG